MAAIIRASHAISFHLLNAEGQSVIGIFDVNKGQTSTLEIINSSRRNLKLKTLEGTEATAAKHHFEVKFRPGTLSLSSDAPITVDPGAGGWMISKPTETDEGVSFYLLSTNPAELKSENRTAVKLNGLNADGNGGGRGTRVELKWPQGSLEYVAQGAPPEPLVAGHRVQHLTIVNERGEKEIPLHVSFVGTNQVVNDGSDNTITLRLTNKKHGKIDLIPDKNPEFPRSTFILSFDTSVNEEWTMGTASVVRGFDVKAVAGGKEFKVRRPEQGEAPIWTFWPSDPISLDPGASIDVTISKMRTQFQPGPTNLYLHYKNIPGYRDGHFVEVIEKTPLFYSRNKVAVGVGVNTPIAALHVRGDLMVEKDVTLGQYARFNVGANGGRFTVTTGGNIGVGKDNPESKLHVAGDLRLENGDLFIKNAGQIKCIDDSHRIIFSANELVLREKGNIVFTPGATSATATAKAVLLANGNFGIGTSSPGKTLTVNGGVRIEKEVSIGGGDPFDIDAPMVPGGRLKVNSEGTVGIGIGVDSASTVKPKLHVNGNVQLVKDKEIFFEDSGQIRSFDNNHRILFRREENKMEFREYGQIVFSPGCKDGNATNKITFREDGRVGLGTEDPTVPLEITTEVPTAFRGQFWYAHLAASSHAPANSAQDSKVSIKAAGAMVSEKAFYVYSDARIKTDFKSSDPVADLDVLSRLRVTDFKYIDVVTCGRPYKKGLIAQQVEEVFPQAVSEHVGVVPDFYQPAMHTEGWIELANDLKPGERVRLLSKESEGVYEVVEATPDKFRTDFKPESEQVFVFGREVKDLRILDHDAIAVLNISATQQLKKKMDQELQTLRVENAELRVANDALEKRLQLLESKLEAMLGVMSATNGSNGNGRH